MEQRDYVRRLLEAYRATPGTCGVVRRPDRVLAAQLHERGVPLEAVENAFVLAAARRLDTARRRRASGNDPLAGILLAGDRRSTATAGQPGILSAPPPQTPTCRLGTIAPITHPPNEISTPHSAPSARMISLLRKKRALDLLVIPVLEFSGALFTPPLARRTNTHGPCFVRWNNYGRSGAGSIRRNEAAELPSTCNVPSAVMWP